MSHSLVTYLVPVLRISTPRAISGIRKLLARNSIGVHSNSRIPYPLPVHTPIPCYTTLVRCAPASFYEWKDRCQIHLSLETILRLSPLIFVNKFVFYTFFRREIGEDWWGWEFWIWIAIVQGIWAMLEFDLRIVQQDFWFGLVKCGSIDRSIDRWEN